MLADKRTPEVLTVCSSDGLSFTLIRSLQADRSRRRADYNREHYCGRSVLANGTSLPGILPVGCTASRTQSSTAAAMSTGANGCLGGVVTRSIPVKSDNCLLRQATLWLGAAFCVSAQGTVKLVMVSSVSFSLVLFAFCPWIWLTFAIACATVPGASTLRPGR